MKNYEVANINIEPKAQGQLGAMEASEIDVGTTLYLRAHITYLANGRTRDSLQFAASLSGPWSEFDSQVKVLIAQFDRGANTRVVLRGRALVTNESSGAATEEAVELSVLDWELDRSRQADWVGAFGTDLTVAPGPFAFPSSGPVTAYHDINFNTVVSYNGASFNFDPLVIIVPRRP